MSLDVRVPPLGMQIKRHRRTFQLVQILELKGHRFLELEWPFWGHSTQMYMEEGQVLWHSVPQ